MNVHDDRDAFDAKQTFLLENIIQAVHGGIATVAPPETDVQEVVYVTVASIAALLDGVVIQEHEGKPFVPVVAFANNPEKTELLVTRGGSWMHEYAYGAVEEYMERNK